MAKGYDSVFDGYNTDDFDAIFDQEDSLVDTVNGCNEAGDPLTGVDFDELHQTEDDDDSDIEDEFGPDHDNRFGARHPEGAQDDYPEDNNKYGSYSKSSEADSFLSGGIQHTKESMDMDAVLGYNIDDVLGEGGDCSDGDCDDDDTDLDESYIFDNDSVFNESDDDILMDEDDDDIDSILGENDDVSHMDLTYESSDEDLIDMAINGSN